jgi:hypothetical protein
MPTPHFSDSRFSTPRPLRSEAGKETLAPPSQKGSRSRRPAPPDSEHTDQPNSDPDLEKELEMPRKDISRRKSRAPVVSRRPPRTTNFGISEDEDAGEDLAERKKNETSSSVAPHMSVLLAMSYHVGLASITRPLVSEYIPDCRNMFVVLRTMCDAICENTLLNELFPGFLSSLLYCYSGYLYFYQILRARDDYGQGKLNLDQRKSLRKLESFGKPEAWPVPAPLIEFIRCFGRVKSTNPQFSSILPKLPTVSGLGSADAAHLGLTRLHTVNGIMRVPLMPALIEQVRLFGNSTAKYNNDQGWLPAPADATLTAGATFCSLASSAATSSPFKCLVSSGGWLLPTEGPLIGQGPIGASTKRGIIRRWSVPNVSATRIQSLQEFLGLSDDVDPSWISKLQAMATIVCRFFPGSTNMSNIDPISTIGALTEVNYSRPGGAVTFVANTWSQRRGEISADVYGYDDTESGRILTRVGLTTGAMNRYSPSTWFSEKGEAERTGPFFFDDTTAGIGDYERRERFLTTGHLDHDVLRRADEQISSLYSPKGAQD